MISLIVALFLLSYYLYLNQGDFKILTQVSPFTCVLIALLYIAFFTMNGLFIKIITLGFSVELHFFEYLSLSILTTFGNTFLPIRGGAGIRAIYLKKKHHLSYSFFIASLAGNYIVVFAVNSLVALVCILVLYITRGFFSFSITSLFLSIVFVCSYVIVFAPESARGVPVEFVRNRLNTVLAGWHVIRASYRNIVLLFLLSSLNLLIVSIITYLEFGALHILDGSGSSITFFQTLFFAVTNTLSLLISITPASLGIREGIMMLVSSVVNVSSANALAVSILDRAINFSLILMTAPFAFWYIRKILLKYDVE